MEQINFKGFLAEAPDDGFIRSIKTRSVSDLLGNRIHNISPLMFYTCVEPASVRFALFFKA